jgi:hypothetical protein
MSSRYFDVSLKNGLWRKIWIRDIKGILIMLKGNNPKNGAKEEIPRIEPLTSRFPHSDLDHYKTVYCTYAYHYVLLRGI